MIPLLWLLIATAVGATLTGAFGPADLHLLLKPLTMLIAIGYVAVYAYATRAKGYFYLNLIAALAASMVGDVFLMLPGDWFIAGLASFLVAHLFYLALFRRGIPRFASRVGLAGTLAAGAVMYGWIWPGLTEPALKLAVAAYVVVIALMAAQAIGRAVTLGDGASRAVAVGACVFMLSDTLIAINRFVIPLPLASLWVLSSYYLAQIMIVANSTGNGWQTGLSTIAPERSEH